MQFAALAANIFNRRFVDDDDEICTSRCGRAVARRRTEHARRLRSPDHEATAPFGIHGAREHNLKNISLEIPRDQMVVITGLSGSGKSTLAFDILFAEGQRRFLDSMSPYARQFVEQLEKPDVDLVEGLPPSVAIEQRVTRGGGKSTVATVTEVYHFLRLLFAKTGTQFCPDCDLPVEKQSLAAIVKQVETAAKRGPLKVLAPLVKARKGFHTDVARWAERQGFDTLFVDGKLDPGRALPEARALQGTHHRRRGRRDRREANPEGAQSGAARARDRPRHRASARCEKSPHRHEHGDELPGLRPRLRGTRSALVFVQFAARLRARSAAGSAKSGIERCKPATEDNGDSVLENELAAERESNGSTKSEARACPSCHGSRLNPVARHVRLQGQTIDDFTALSAGEALALIGKLRFRGTQKTIAADLVPEIEQRLHFMEQRRARLSRARSFREDVERRRIAAHPAGGAARLESARRALRAR